MDTSPTPTMNSADVHEDKPEVVALHPSGDVIIVIFGPGGGKCHGRFLVSSATLSLASSYFRTHFGPKFKEGADLRKSTCPEIGLEEDWPEEIEILISILQFHNLHHYWDLDPKTVALVAHQSDNYDCGAALLPWGVSWFHDIGQLTDEQYGYLLTAAYSLDSDEGFRAVLDTAIQHSMTADFRAAWESNELIDGFPQQMKNKVEQLSIDTLRKMYDVIYAVERPLQNRTSDVYTLRGRRLRANCTAEARVADYFKALRQENLWPPSRLRISEIAETANRPSEYKWHECSGERVCDLKRGLREVQGKIDIIVKSLEGISIKSIYEKERNARSTVSYGYH